MPKQYTRKQVIDKLAKIKMRQMFSNAEALEDILKNGCLGLNEEENDYLSEKYQQETGDEITIKG